jgi:farnesyl diphosphate synthase
VSELIESLRRRGDAVTAVLDLLLPPVAGPRGRVVEAMRYAALGGGKRLRPFLVMECAGLFDVDEDHALRTAAAIEMIHCYSLVHDDLPAMDDSDLRRGRPTVHKVFDEATAILAGDGLLTEAFAVIADPASHPDGLDLEGITHLQALKTGALITFACESGAILGDAGPGERAALLGYARAVGLAFQIADDLLDSLSTPEELGKPTGQDEVMGKATFVGQLGIEGARAQAGRLVEEACGWLDIFSKKADLLRETATYVVERRT